MREEGIQSVHFLYMISQPLTNEGLFLLLHVAATILQLVAGWWSSQSLPFDHPTYWHADPEVDFGWQWECWEDEYMHAVQGGWVSQGVQADGGH
jgi:hypothetical protein